MTFPQYIAGPCHNRRGGEGEKCVCGGDLFLWFVYGVLWFATFYDVLHGKQIKEPVCYSTTIVG